MSENKVLAVVNGKEITNDEVQAFIQMMGQQGMQFNNEEGIKKITDELVNQELFYLDAIKTGLDKDEEYIKEVERIKESALKQYAVNNFLKDIKIEDSEVAEYYESHKDYFKKPEMVTASHILVEEEELANKIKKEIEEGKSFEDAATEYSTCPSKEKGGSLGQFGRGQMVPEFEQAAFEAEVNHITEPVKSQFGYHIIRVDGKTDDEYATLEEVRDEVTRQLTGLKQQEVYLNKAKDLSKEYKVEKLYNK